jgi:phytoene dehydrogenase-like protein
VLVLERRYIVGGACVSEETFPGYEVSTASYVNSLFHTQIVCDLNLEVHGYEATSLRTRRGGATTRTALSADSPQASPPTPPVDRVE